MKKGRLTRIPNKPRGWIVGAQWEGIPVKARVVSVIVGRPPDTSWWCSGLEGQRWTAVEITPADGSAPFYIDNADGLAIWKVTRGHGHIFYGHRLLPAVQVLDDPNIAAFYK